MEIPDKILRVACLVLIACLVVGALYGAVKKANYDARIIELQNTVAERDVTVETQKGVFQKLSIQSKSLENMLGQRDEQIKLLKREIEKGGEDVLAANSLVIRWKKAYEATVKAQQTEVPGAQPSDPVRKRVTFEKDFGMIGVSGFTLTDPAEATVTVKQNRPLKVSLVVSQDKDGVWKSRATSSDDNTSIDIALSSVNPWMLEPKWYEKIGVGVELGVGSGFLAGAGAFYRFGKFDLGPKGWVTVTGPASGFVGAQVIWHPFAR